MTSRAKRARRRRRGSGREASRGGKAPLLGALTLLALGFVACEPHLPSNDWLVTSPRVIAVKGEPAETKPGESATYTAFIADPAGDGGRDVATFAFCTAPKSPAENAVVSSACLDAASLRQLGEGDSVVAQTPFDACTLFGPIAAPGGFRPRDPDVTGGYYQPLRVDLDREAPVFHLARVSCGVANASADVASAFAQAYLPNQNPHIASLAGAIDGRAVDLSDVPAGARVDLTASWDAADVETFAYVDAGTGLLGTERESMQLAWNVTAGELDTESTSRSASDLALSMTNRWTAPDAPGVVRLWLALRDSRGGVDVLARDVTVSR